MGEFFNCGITVQEDRIEIEVFKHLDDLRTGGLEEVLEVDLIRLHAFSRRLNNRLQYRMVGNIESGCPDTGLKAFAVYRNDRYANFISNFIYDTVDILTDNTCCTGTGYEDRLRGISLVDFEDNITECIC